MVRKGSPVRVRQRALENPLETAGFLLPRCADAASISAREPLFGRLQFVSALTLRGEKCPNSAGRGLSASVRRSSPEDVEWAIWRGDEVVQEVALAGASAPVPVTLAISTSAVSECSERIASTVPAGQLSQSQSSPYSFGNRPRGHPVL